MSVLRSSRVLTYDKQGELCCSVIRWSVGGGFFYGCAMRQRATPVQSVLLRRIVTLNNRVQETQRDILKVPFWTSGTNVSYQNLRGLKRRSIASQSKVLHGQSGKVHLQEDFAKEQRSVTVSEVGVKVLSSLPFERDEGTAFRIFLDLKSKHHFIMEKKANAFFFYVKDCRGLQVEHFFQSLLKATPLRYIDETM